MHAVNGPYAPPTLYDALLSLGVIAGLFVFFAICLFIIFLVWDFAKSRWPTTPAGDVCAFVLQGTGVVAYVIFFAVCVAFTLLSRPC